MDAAELARWTRFAAKGGIGKCTAVQDCVAQSSEDLMFLKDDEITVLMQLPEQDNLYLGYCEGVVGRFRGEFVHFHSKLKRPVMTKRSSVHSSKSSTPVPYPKSPSPLMTPVDSPSVSQFSHASSSQPGPSRNGTGESDGRAPPTLSRSDSTTNSENTLETPPMLSPTSARDSTASADDFALPNPHYAVDPRFSSILAGGTDIMDLDQHALRPPSPIRHEDIPDTPPLRITSPPSRFTKLHDHEEQATFQSWQMPIGEQQAPAASSADNLSVGDEHITRRNSTTTVDGETGIGLTFLQNMTGGDGDDWSSTYSRRSLASDVTSLAEGGLNYADDESVYEERAVNDSASVYSKASMLADTSHDTIEDPRTPNAQASFKPQEPEETPSPTPRGSTDQDADRRSESPPTPTSARPPASPRSIQTYSTGQDLWDIYDDYRYSRYSMASKMSRYSTASHRQFGSSSSPPPPPVPGRERVNSYQSGSSVYTQASKVSGTSSSQKSDRAPGTSAGDSNPPAASDRAPSEPDAQEVTYKGRPPSLQLSASLLHTTWASPSTSPSSTGDRMSYASQALPSPGLGPGAASSLRQQLELNQQSVPAKLASPHSPDEDGNEDEDEVVVAPRDSVHSRAETESDYSDDRSSRSNSPDLTIGHLPPLSVTNASDTGHSSETTHTETAHDAPARSAPPIVVEQLTSVQSTSSPIESPLSPDGGTLGVSLPPSQSPSPTSHLRIPRPSLQELRGEDGAGQRTSLFAPHPNAPKPTADSSGPMYLRSGTDAPPMPYTAPQQHVAPRPSVIVVIRQALAGPPPSHLRRGPTVYGILDMDLSQATGPVPVRFSVEPPPATAPGGRLPTPMSPPLRAATVPIVAPQPVGSPPLAGPPSRTGSPVVSTFSLPERPSSAASSSSAASGSQQSTASGAIPRANFFPKAGTARPRSRSFSGFNNTQPELELSKDNTRPSPATQPVKPKGRTMSTQHASSPLAHSAVTSLRGAASKAPTSPLAQHSITRPASTISTKRASLLPKSSMPNLGERASISSVASSSRPTPLRASSTASTSRDGSEPPLSPTTTVDKHSRNPTLDSLASRARPSTDNDSASIVSGRSQMTSPAPGRQSSLRSKLSLPNLRRSGDKYESPSFSTLNENETMQVQDMDFELVRPTIPHLSRSSEDSTRTSMESVSLPRPGVPGMLRPESPALSTISAPRSPTAPADPSAPRLPVSINKPPDAESVEGHRQRELKWVSLMSAVPPSHARKSKKVKKLLYEGVPSSVRYLVWSHLMDSRGKSVPTVYGQLAKRERVAAYHQIERDAQQSAFDHPNLAPTQTSLLSLLQSYLCMVPDITYSQGLTLIAGHLLLLAPEEDAFWIFVTLMDAYLRPYFSPNTTQLEVDAALFCRALESNDSQVAKKILTEIGIGAVELCRPWFTTLFVDALPSEYVNRVWDFFLCEGLPLLIRVGLAVISCCRRAILECKTEESLLRYITAPPPTWFPPTVDAFITVVMSAKVKDDDVRKQRVKMEAQIKRQTQQGPRLQTNFISLPKP